MYRQGDVLLRPINIPMASASPVELPREDGRLILALGEATGHAHAITDESATMLRDRGSGRTFLKVLEPGATLSHEEHNAIAVPPGEYEIVHQKTQDPREERRTQPRASYD